MHARNLAGPAIRPATRPGLASRGRLVNGAIIALTGAVILSVAYLANRPADATGLTAVQLVGTPTGPAPIVGQTAPDFTAATVDGKPIRLSDLKGSPVWVSFGASWCQPCRAENPDIEAAYEAFKAKGVVVIQIYMTEDTSTVADYTTRVGLTYQRIPDPDSRLATEYRILGIPSHFFIGRDGVLRELKVGTLDRDSMNAILAELAG